MIPSTSAASLVQRTRLCGHPPSVDSIPTSAGQEDTFDGELRAMKPVRVWATPRAQLAIELLCRRQGDDFFAPLEPGGRGPARRGSRVVPRASVMTVLAGTSN